MPSGVRLPHPFATHGETEQIKTQKILNRAGNSWSQIFIKLSEYVMVHILSKYWTLFFVSHNAWLPWQPATKIEPSKQQNNVQNLAKITVFSYFIPTKSIYIFCFQYKLWERSPWPNIVALSLLYTYSSRSTMAISCMEVYPTFRLNEKISYFLKVWEHVYKIASMFRV